MSNIPNTCPSCAARLKVRRLGCELCETAIEGSFDLPPLARLSGEEQAFVLRFVAASGSLKAIASQMKLSYPTIRNRLNDIISRLDQLAATGHNVDKTKGILSCRTPSSYPNPLKTAAFKSGSSTPSTPSGQE